MSLDVITLALAKSYTDQHGGSGGASTADGVSYTNEHLTGTTNVKGALDELVSAKLTGDENFVGIGNSIHGLEAEAHTHGNKSTLDKFAESKDGNPTFDGKALGGASDFIIKMTVEANGDNYTVTACDATVEQIDAEFNADKNIVLTVAQNGETNKYVLSLVNATPGLGYFFESFYDAYLLTANIDKRDGTIFAMAQMPANAIAYSNDAIPTVDNVGDTLDELVPKSHTHSNKDTLDKLSVSDGKLQYNGSDVGLKGDKGDTGAKGADGKTPVKGVDYWTAADKQEIIDDIHPAYYIDLAGTYPNYTCPVAMDDIKAAYNSGYNLVCRCTLGVYTATLPLFIPMPAANTWIFSGSGALQSMGFPAQSFTVAITSDGVKAQQTGLARADGTLPNPHRLRITVGNTAYLYDGNEAVNVVIDDGTEVSY